MSMAVDRLNKFRERPVLRHLKRLTTKDGLIQHADLEVPDPSFGYSIDDNARGIIACIWHYKNFKDPSVLNLLNTYFSYIKKVVKKENGSFHNFLSFSGEILDKEGSEDSIGRAIWSLGEIIKNKDMLDGKMVIEAREIINETNISRHLNHRYIRCKAYISLGLMAAGMSKEARPWISQLVEFFNKNSSKDWVWFEDGLYYANGILPYALTVAAEIFKEEELKDIAEKSYRWLDDVSTVGGLPNPIGQDGWYEKGKNMTLYDQQPLEAADMIIAAAELYKLTKEGPYIDAALKWYGWYEGNNSQKSSLINDNTGGIFDGVTREGINKNQGAESIVTYLMAYLILTELSTNE